MSGIEVAGLVLGALPILFAAVDFSKDGIHRVGAAFRRKKYVEKLARALLLQQQILEETVKSLLMASGCEDVWRFDQDPLSYLKNPTVREDVLDYLGTKNDAAFAGALQQSSDIVKRIAKNIAGLVPAFKDASDDLLEIIKANQDTNGKRLDLNPRIKLLFGVTQLKEAVQELDDTASALDRFTRIVLSNRQTVDDMSSKKAVKLARGLHHVRKFAGNLSLAISKSWKIGCHSKHEARLFLEDRLDTAVQISKQIGKESFEPILVFQLIFAASMDQGQTLWHEASVQVFDDENDEHADQTSVSSHPCVPQVTFASSGTMSRSRREITTVESICGVMETAQNDNGQTTFVLVEKQRIGTISTNKGSPIGQQQTEVTTLKALLSAGTSRNHGPILPWKFRMLLALKLASNLLQLIQTQWLERAWSKEVVYFMLNPKCSDGQGKCQVDLGRPFVSLSFDSSILNAGDSPSIEPKVALLELGILLLEVWHEITLETRFGCESAPSGYYQRLALATEWLDDTTNPLPDLYDKAISHCIHRSVGGSRVPDWDDMKFWGAMCGDVIEPLSKNCKQWR
ncbi:hypothetical protein BGZ60DRAFT_396930 [Tricladium varicosporioides]|nr:hypothetical protein BGZ60DRAFT_396930 [Hymenoscyphus varicosporioides]